jgi:biopolymer transport protein ExbB/TolQ
MNLNLFRIWLEMGPLVRIVVAVLTIQGVACLTVVIDRIVVLFRSRARSRAFASQANALLEARDHKKLLEVARGAKGHLAALMDTGIYTYLKNRGVGERHEKAVELTRRALDRRQEELGSELNRGLSILASTGSTAPFVGLLGTVLGIINAFRAIAETGSGGLGTIGAAIGEALVVTGYGLVIAIPTVLAFNWLTGKVTKYETGLAIAAGELVDHLEVQELFEAEAAFPAAAAAPGNGSSHSVSARRQPRAAVAVG